jgi:cold shock CspA family protein
MPRGRVKWFDSKAGEGSIVRQRGGELPVRASDIEPKARIARAVVQFDIEREEGMRRAVNVRLHPGTRVSGHERRYAEIGGGRALGHAHVIPEHTDVQVHLEGHPTRVAHQFMQLLQQSDLATLTHLYAPDARLHADGPVRTGRNHIQRYFTASPLLGLQASKVTMRGEDATILIEWAQGGLKLGETTTGWTRLKISEGQIVEQWMEISEEATR